MLKLVQWVCIFLLYKDMTTTPIRNHAFLKHQTQAVSTNRLKNDRKGRFLRLSQSRIGKEINSTFNKKSLRRESILQENCVGWCLHIIQDSLLNTNISPVTTDKVKVNGDQGKRFAKMRSIIKNNPYFLVKVEANVYADRAAYEDRMDNLSRGQLLQKNVIKVPSEIYYPYTKNDIERMIDNNNNVYDPSKQ